MIVIRTLFVAMMMAFAMGLPWGAAGAAVGAPDAMVKSTVDDVLSVIRKTKDKRALRQLAEEKVLPNFDFKQMTRSAVGPGWRKASPTQQEALENGFRSIVVNTYTSALSLSSNTDATVEVKPMQAPTGQSDVTVKTVVKQSGKPPMQIDYRLSNASGDWKVNDVVVEGISLVTTYRSEFSETINSSGVDGLLKKLEAKNRSIAGA
jgi:phospholipid transport system substrate-binding protein